MDLVTLHTFIKTDLADVPLQIILTAADEDLTLAVGPDTTMIEERMGQGQPNLWLQRPAASITSITLTDPEGTVTTLDTTDWHLDPAGKILTRLRTGTNPDSGWNNRVTVTYVPADLNKRQRALVALVQLELDYRHGKKSENIGDHTMTQADYNIARAQIISQAMTRTFA